MKWKLLFVVLLALCGITAVQNRSSSKQEELDKKQQAQMDALQRKIDRQERDLSASLAQWEKTNLPHVQPRRTIVMNIAGEAIFISYARNGLRVGDIFLTVRLTDKGRVIGGKGRVARVYPTEAEAGIIENYQGVRPEDEVYVVNRSGSPHSIRWAQFEAEGKP
jgi:hypothetical protein